MDNIVEQLKTLKEIKPRAEWKNSSRELLLSQISAQTENSKTSVPKNVWFFTKSIMPSSVLRFVAQPIGVMSVILLFVAGTGILGVNASKTSLPGDLLYPVKLTSEKVSLSLTINDSKKAEKHLEYAEERVNEMEAVSAQPLEDKDKKAKMKQAVSGLMDQMEGAQIQLDKVKDAGSIGQSENKIIVEVALGVDKKAEELSQKIALKKEEYKEDKELETAFGAAQASTNQTGVKAVEVVINGVENSKLEMPTKEIMNVIQKKIANTAVTVEEMKKYIEQADPVEVIVNMKDKPSTATNTLTEAQQFLNQGDLTGAIEKIKTTVGITNEVKDTVSHIEATVISPPPVIIDTETDKESTENEVKVNADVIIKPTN